MPKQKFLVTFLSALTLGGGLWTTSAEAATLTVENALLLTQGTFPDVDVASLANLFGHPAALNPNLETSIGLDFKRENFTVTSSTAFLKGYYPTPLNIGDSQVNINYVIDTSQYSSTGIISWTKQGSYGSNNLGGGGSIKFEDTGDVNFKATFNNLLNVNGQSDNQSYELFGTVDPLEDPTTIEYSTPDESTNGTIEVSIDLNPPLSPATQATNNNSSGRSQLVVVTPTKINPNGQVIPSKTLLVLNSCKGNSCRIIIPEPSSVLGLLSISVVGAGSIIKQKLKKKA